MNKIGLGVIGLMILLGSGCAERFVFETDSEFIDFDALGSGKIIATSNGHHKNYYIDIDAREAYLLPLPKRNENNLAVDPAGNFVYTVDKSELYRAVPGEWDWEKLPYRLPEEQEPGGWIYHLEVDPTASTLYFIWVRIQAERALMALDLSSGDTTNLSQKLGFSVLNFAINPVSGDLVVPYFRATDSMKVLLNVDPQSFEVDSLFVLPLGEFDNYSSLPPLSWLPNGQEIAMVYPHKPDSIYRIDLQSRQYEAMFDRHDLFYFHSPFAFSPSGERYALGFNDAFQVDEWNPSQERFDHSKKLIHLGDVCDFSCHGASKIYWFP